MSVRNVEWPKGIVALLLGLLAGAAAAPAQQPSQAQIGAIKQSCRSDYMKQCSGVPTGGTAALQCLQQHAAATSPGCQRALAAVSPPAPSSAASAPAASPPAEAAAPDGTATWPHTLTKDGASVTIYQPQAISWPDRQKLTARAAIAVTPAGQTKQVLGTIELSLTTHTDDATGIVSLSDPVLLDTHFPSLDTQRAQQLDAKIRADLPDDGDAAAAGRDPAQSRPVAGRRRSR